ncbi:family 16 glycosylhydrolase [Curtobacterium sp. SP.BCo]|uniref:glycoside hydrolase family 16 protein n=1 Tax=Curtobacterium sp. SP.BCo TaxID=3435229 RepID=UPI003F73B6D1
MHARARHASTTNRPNHRRRRIVIAAATVSALLIGVPTAASAHTWWGWGGRGHHAPPTAPVSPTPTDEASPSDDPTPSDEPTDGSTPSGAPITAAPEPTESAEPDTPAADAADADADQSTLAPAASFVEDFDVPAVAGTLSNAYKQAWQPYPDGTSGIYVPSKTVSVHDGVMDVALGGAGAAGTFGSTTGAYSHVGGSFSVRAKATGGDGNGAAFMLWPSSDKWSDGEIDFPEGNFESRPSAFQHSMTPGQEAERTQLDSGVSWRDWHTYTIDWDPGKSVTYKVDGNVIGTITHDVPTTEHRFMFQTGNWGASGNLLIDWVSTTE